jgi:hypothetical protein
MERGRREAEIFVDLLLRTASAAFVAEEEEEDAVKAHANALLLVHAILTHTHRDIQSIQRQENTVCEATASEQKAAAIRNRHANRITITERDLLWTFCLDTKLAEAVVVAEILSLLLLLLLLLRKQLLLVEEDENLREDAVFSGFGWERLAFRHVLIGFATTIDNSPSAFFSREAAVS